ncbi:MAG: aspartate/glutamate racemase family protein [Chloroflexota bacterium]
MSDRQKTVFVLHTSFATVEMFRQLLEAHLLGVRIVNVVDDSLLADVRAAGRVTPSVTRRMVGYAVLAQGAGADAIFSTCSSVGEVADLIRQAVDIPVVKIDDCMAEEAVALGERVAVVATVPTTLEPTARLIASKGRDIGREVEIRRHLVEGAFDALMAGRADEHDRLVMAEVERAAQGADVVVLAQASMARLVPQLGELPVPVLSSPLGGVESLRRALQ